MVVLNTCRLMGCESCDQTEGQVEVSNDKRERQTDRGKKNKRERDRQREEEQERENQLFPKPSAPFPHNQQEYLPRLREPFPH